MKITEFISRAAGDFLGHRYQIWDLTRRHLKARTAGSLLGFFWIFAQPSITILVFWFVFEVGFKSKPVADVPFVLWLVCGMVPWFFFADAVTAATNSIAENTFLVKRVVFRTGLLPATRILSALLVHLFFIVIVLLMSVVYGHYPDMYWIQLPYYMIAMTVLLMGLSLITSSAVLFYKDVGQVVQALLQFLFWGTPIFWSLSIMPERYHPVMKLNPLYYVVNGYRDCLVNGVWLWKRPLLGLYFWATATVTLLLGRAFFRRLKPHFADVV